MRRSWSIEGSEVACDVILTITRGVSLDYAGSLGFNVFVHLNPKESPRLHRVSVTPFHFFAALQRGSASVLFALVRVPTELFAVVLS